MINKILNNRILNILFNPSIPISRQEYWAGLILLFMCISIQLTSLMINEGIHAALSSGSGDNLYTQIFAKQIFNSFSPSFIPYASIILYSSFILSYKRCKTVKLDKLKWVSGLFTFLLYSSPIASTGILAAATQNMRYESESLVLYSSILVATIFIIGILTILLLSFGGISTNEKKEENPNSSIIFLFRLFRLYIITAVLVIIYMLVAEPRSYKESSLIFVYILGFVYLITYVWLIIKRVIDAGVNILIPIGILLSIPIMILCYNLLYISGLPSSSPMITSCLILLMSTILSLLNVLFLILVALPSQSDNELSEENNLSETIESIN